VNKSLDAMAERTRIACFDVALEQATACPIVVFDGAWPPPARNLYLGTALLVPLIEPLDEVDSTTDFKLYYVWPFGICGVQHHRCAWGGGAEEQKATLPRISNV